MKMTLPMALGILIRVAEGELERRGSVFPGTGLLTRVNIEKAMKCVRLYQKRRLDEAKELLSAVEELKSE